MRRTSPGAQNRDFFCTFLKNTRENFRFRKNKIFEFFIIIREKVPGLGNGLGCNTQASGAPNDGFFMPNHVFFMPNQRFALPKPGFRCQNLRWAADILTAVVADVTAHVFW